MTVRDSESFLRQILFADGIVSGATGLLLAVGAPLAAPLLGLPPAFWLGAGAFLVAFGVTVVVMSRSAWLSPAAARTVVAANLAWVGASIALAALGPESMTGLGRAFVVLQALVVGVLAELQIVALRRAVLRPRAA